MISPGCREGRPLLSIEQARDFLLDAKLALAQEGALETGCQFMKMFCTDCLSEQDVEISTRTETIPVRGEPIEVSSRVARCTKCRAEVLDSALADETLRSAYLEYRKKHGLLLPEEMKQIREQYDLSYRAFARLMGWGLVTVQRYERGAVQDQAHDAILREMRDNPAFVYAQFESKKDRLTDSDVKRMETCLSRLYERKRTSSLVREFETQESLAFKHNPSVRGNRAFSFDRASEVVLFFASRVSDLYQTKLAKLLWVSDFAAYVKFGRSLTGLAYARLPFGPVPDRFRVFLALMDELGKIQLEPKESDGYSGEIIRFHGSTQVFGTLTSKELELLSRVVGKYGRSSCTRLSKMSHREDIWTSRTAGSLLPYSEASTVTMVAALCDSR